MTTAKENWTMIEQLDYHIADNAQQPAILLTDASDGTTLGTFPLGSDDPLVFKIIRAYNAHDALVEAAREMREYIRNRPATFENGSILARANRAIDTAEVR